MPVAHINLLKGHERKTLRRIIVEVSDAMSEILGAPKDRLEVWISEHDHDLWGIGGVPASEVLAHEDRRKVEMPFVQMVLMEGRPKEQHHRIIAAITDILHHATGVEKGRIRIHIANAQPDSWGIGGVPASISRAREIEARKLQTAG